MLDNPQPSSGPAAAKSNLRWFRHLLIRSVSPAQFLAFLYPVFVPGFIMLVIPKTMSLSGAEFAAYTAVICGFCYYACSRVGLGILEFGADIDISSVHRFQRVWLLSLRYHAMLIFLILLLTPAAIGCAVPLSSLGSWTLGFALAINLFLLQILFCLIAIMNRVGATPTPIRQFLLYAIFPFRFIGFLIGYGIGIAYLALILARAFWKFGGQRAFAEIDIFLNWLSTITAVGPLAVYIINPVYHLLNLLRQNPQLTDWTMLASFGGVTLLLIAVLAHRLQRVLWSDWTTGHAQFYNYWLESREAILAEVMGSLPSKDPEKQAGHRHPLPDLPAESSSRRGIPIDPAPEVTSPSQAMEGAPTADGFQLHTIDYTLPAGMTGEDFIASLGPQGPLLSRGKIIILLIALGATIFYDSVAFVITVLIWYIVSSDYVMPFHFSTWITPQNPWRYIRITIRKTWPYLAGDVILALLGTYVLLTPWPGALLLVVYAIGIRSLILTAKIAYYMQAAVIFAILIFGGLIYAAAAYASIWGTTDRPLFCGIALGVIAVVWLALAYHICIRRSNLAHYPPANRM